MGIQGVTNRKEKSNSLFCHENAIKIFFSTQIIVCHMHPFTLVTKTYLLCLLSESNKVFKKRPEIPEKSNCEKSKGNKKYFFSNLKQMYDFQNEQK